jgi:undecaprenyl-diphosphatase
LSPPRLVNQNRVMISGGGRTSGQSPQRHFRLGDGNRLTASGCLVLYAVSLGLALAGAASFVLTLGEVLQHDGITALDEPMREWFVSHRTGFATAVLAGFAIVFGPVVLPVVALLVTTGWALLTRRFWRPLLLAAAMVTGVIITEVTAHLVSRSRPPSELMMLGADPTSSFPSGHVVGASNFLLIGAYLVFSRSSRAGRTIAAFGAAAAGMLLEATSRIYLGYHWFTDTVGSVSVSTVLLAAVIAVDITRGGRGPGEEKG